MKVIHLQDLSVSKKRLLIREDFNVPIKNSQVNNDARIRAALPTIRWALDQNASVILMSHLGRPKEGSCDSTYSLAPVAQRLSELLGQQVPLVQNYLQQPVTVTPGQVVLLENVRFNIGEKADDAQLSEKLASLCDIFVMDAFGTAHRAQASTHGVGLKAPVACAGPLLSKELTSLEQALSQPSRPSIAIVGGSKVSTKLTVLESLANICDRIIVGGGIANTFLAAKGYSVGQSLCELELIDQASALLEKVEIPLPEDVVVATSFDEYATGTIKAVSEVSAGEVILDVGPKTQENFSQLISSCQTIIWNGPVGVFEFAAFQEGTKALAKAIAASKGFSLAGGGDTIAAIDTFGVQDQISYISTGGGAFLEFVEGKTLPAVAMLMHRAEKI